MSEFKEPYKITCKEAQLLMVPLWANMRGIADEEKEAFDTHILACSTCAKKYEETKKLMSLVKANWGPISPETRKLLEKAGYKVEEQLPKTRKMTVEEGWQDLLRRCPDLAEAVENERKLKWIKRISAIAACLAIGIFTWLIFSTNSKPDIHYTSKQVASAPTYSVKIELVKPSGNIAISDNEIIADNELKTLLINGRHQMVLNIGTNLSIEPLTIDSNLGCLIKLNSGEIYTHVEHDGNPFIVQMPNGRAIITGTTFDIKAENNKTTLIVSEGCVQLQSEKGKVSVGADRSSQIVGDSAPALPVKCEVSNLTAWATGYKSDVTLAKAKIDNDTSWQPPLSTLRPKPIELDKTDYKSWVEEKREWFNRNFPWIFEFKNALAEERIEIDYPEILIKTGDIWQFMCLDEIRMPAKFSIPDFNSLLKTATFYGFDEEWLLKNVPTAKVALGQKFLLQNPPTGITAFKQLLKYAEGKEEPSYGFYIADACKYIADTRSLIWFAVRNGKFNLANTQRTEVLDLLQQEVTAACNCQNEMLYSDEPKLFCEKDKDKTIGANIAVYIEMIKDVETMIANYKSNIIW